MNLQEWLDYGVRVLGGCLLTGWAGSVGAADKGGANEFNDNRFQLPPLAVEKSIQVDGIIDEKEWAGALRISGFVFTGSPFLEPRQGFTCVAWDHSYLYLAVSSELPPGGKLVAQVTQRDENTVHDDSVEIWLDPNRANKLAGQGDRRFYQLIVNSIGNLYDLVIDPVQGVPNSGWDAKGFVLKCRLNTEANRWEFELALPWSAFAVDPAQLAGRDMGLLVARNFKYPWVQAPYLPSFGFADWKRAPVITFQAGAPVVQEQGFGPVFDGVVEYASVVRNPGAAPLLCKAVTTLTPDDMPVVRRDETLTVPPGGEVAYRFEVKKGYLHKETPFTFLTTLSAVDGKAIYASRTLSVKPQREKVWQMPDQVDDSSAFRIAYYPTARNLRVKLDLTEVKDGGSVSAAGIQVLDAKGKVVLAKDAPLSQRGLELELPLPGLPNGTYTVRATCKGQGAPAKPFAQNLVIRHFPWEASTLGITDKVFPPFTPVTVKGNQVEVVLRRLTLNGFGLWDSVVAHGRELLAAPMRVEYSTAAGPGKWRTQPLRLGAQRENAVTFEAVAESAELRLAATSRIEEDGCMQVTLELGPIQPAVPVKLAGLAIAIPLHDAVAPLWHACVSGAIRSNPVGAAPAGEGLVWDSTRTGNGAMINNILPYIWLGGVERGLAWFCDNDKGWLVDETRPQMTLTREKGVLTLRLHLVNGAAELAEPRTIVFGLQASPTKPMPQDLRTRTDVPMHGGSNGYWGIWSTFAGKYPADNDYTFADEMLAKRVSGQADPDFLARWCKEKLDAVSKDAAWLEDRKRHFGAGYFNMVSDVATPRMLYFEEHCQDQTTPEWVAYQDEWGLNLFTPRSWETKPERSWGILTGFPPSYQNFALWHALQWYTRGIGMYCDNTFPRNNYNPVTSGAYQRADGQVQPSSELWNLRAYHKRLWLLEKQTQPLTPCPLLISLHMTNGNLIPVITWADITLDNEWGWADGTEPFPPEVLRAEMCGTQTGNYPHALFSVFGVRNTGGGLAKEAIARVEWGMRFVHEILRQAASPLEEAVRRFGYGQSGCTVLHYWDRTEGAAGDPGIELSNPKVRWLGLLKPAEKKLLVVLVNWTGEPQTVDVRLVGPLKSRNVLWRDAEKGAELTPAGVPLQGWEVRLLEASPGNGRVK